MASTQVLWLSFAPVTTRAADALGVSDGAIGDLAVVNLVRTDGTAELSHQLQEPLDAAQLILNLRAEADPELLSHRVMESLTEIAIEQSVTLHVEHLERFRPGKPEPTHRLAGV